MKKLFVLFCFFTIIQTTFASKKIDSLPIARDLKTNRYLSSSCTGFRCLGFRMCVTAVSAIDEPLTFITVQVCCRIWANALEPISCIFNRSEKDNTITAYVAVSDMDAQGKAFFDNKKLKEVKISKSDAQDIDGKTYRIRDGIYPILEDPKLGKYTEVVLELVKS